VTDCSRPSFLRAPLSSIASTINLRPLFCSFILNPVDGAFISFIGQLKTFVLFTVNREQNLSFIECFS